MFPSFSALSVFQLVAETQSVSEAARQLNFTQPAVSRMIIRMEEDFGTKLFVRSGNKLTLTGAGRILLKQSSKALVAMEIAKDEIESRRRLEAGVLAIGSSHMLTHYYLLPALKTFREKTPNVAIHMENAGILETVRCLLDERIELGIVTTPYGSTGGIEFLPFAEMEDVFAAGERFIELKDQTVSMHELARYPIIAMKEGRITRTYQEKCFASRGGVLKPAMVCDMMALTIDFAEAGLGIGWVCDQVVRQSIAAGMRIFPVRLDRPLPSRKVGIIKRAGVDLSLPAKHFLEALGITPAS